MDVSAVTQITRETLYVIIITSAPLLLTSLVVGLAISIFQTVTSIQEQTLTFVPKAITIVVLLLVLGSFYMSSIESFIDYIFDIIAQVCRHEGVVAAAVLSAV